MPRVRVTHETVYRYAQPVRLLGHRLMLRPRDSHDLRLLETELSVSPPAASTRWAHDVFGNSVCYLTFPDDAPTEQLRIVSTLDLRHYPTGTALPLDPFAEAFPFGYTSEEVPDLARSIERHCPDPDRLIDVWAHRFLNSDGPTRTATMLTAITQAIKAEFTYDPDATLVSTPAIDAFEARRGVCQDFAHIMISGLRGLGLPAAYVSGYLRTIPPPGKPRLEGADATHAWVDLWCGNALGWVGFDPTNALIVAGDHIVLAVGRDYADVAPMGGVVLGPGDQTIEVAVDVVPGTETQTLEDEAWRWARSRA